MDFTLPLKKLIKPEGKNSIENGLLYLKGGDLTAELNVLGAEFRVIKISGFFTEEFFSTKQIIHLYHFK